MREGTDCNKDPATKSGRRDEGNVWWCVVTFPFRARQTPRGPLIGKTKNKLPVLRNVESMEALPRTLPQQKLQQGDSEEPCTPVQVLTPSRVINPLDSFFAT